MAKKTTKKSSAKKAPAKKKAASKKKTTPRRKSKVDDQANPEMDLPETPAAQPKSDANPTDKKMSGITAAAKLLAETNTPMNVGDITNTIIERGWWNPGGKTPDRTLYSAIITEIKKKGDEARFRRAEERGKFEINS
jgi:hypothetical protein